MGQRVYHIVASFSKESGSVATVGETPVSMIVTYCLAEDTTATPYTTTYNIRVVAKAYEGPEFSGSVSKTALIAVSPVAVTFTAGDFKGKYSANDGKEIESIIIDGTNRDFGKLQLKGADYVFNSAISMADVGSLTFVATGAGDVSYLVYAVEKDTAEQIGKVYLNITIDEVTPPTVKSSVSKSAYANTALTFAATDFTSCCNLNDGKLAEIEITPGSSGFGTWYNGSSAFTGAKPFTSTTISNLKFTGSAAGTETFTWRISNEAGYSEYGTGTIAVSFNVSDIPYTTVENTKITFSASDFNTICSNATGANLSYVKFTQPSSTYGKLYYNYTSSSNYDSVVSESKEYNRSSSLYLSYVSFVPTSGYVGKVSISYTGYNSSGASYSGKIIITVGSNTVDTVTYNTDENKTVVFSGSDFNAVCDDAGFDTPHD